jgi:hypothetical protein
MKKKVRAYRNSHPPVRCSAVCRVRESVREGGREREGECEDKVATMTVGRMISTIKTRQIIQNRVKYKKIK